MLEKPNCEQCRMLQEQSLTVLTCKDCLPPLMPENVDVVKVWTKCRLQQTTVMRSSPMGLQAVSTDLDIKAVMSYMDLIGVEDKERCFELVYMMYHEEQEANKT